MIDTDTRFPTYQVVDGFAGPGGWSLACARLGLKEIGIETDKAAHQTRRAAGFHTIRASVADLGPANFPNAVGKIDSPPCQTFSMAGKGAGRKALDTVLAAVESMAHGIRYPLTEWEDARTGLVLEPLRWHLDAHALGKPYRWIALEQVPTVLPVWHAYAEVLESLGYSVAVGNMHAEQYGVPQTRKRAILIASLDREVSLPTPTHSRYHTRDRAIMDPHVLPWVSSGSALGRSGWLVSPMNPARTRMRHSSEPAPTITGGKSAPWAFVPESAVDTAPDWRRLRCVPAHRMDAAQLGVLQGFASSYPWQGSQTKRCQEAANAIPPLLAEAILRAVT